MQILIYVLRKKTKHLQTKQKTLKKTTHQKQNRKTIKLSRKQKR